MMFCTVENGKSITQLVRRSQGSRVWFSSYLSLVKLGKELLWRSYVEQTNANIDQKGGEGTLDMPHLP